MWLSQGFFIWKDEDYLPKGGILKIFYRILYEIELFGFLDELKKSSSRHGQFANMDINKLMEDSNRIYDLGSVTGNEKYAPESLTNPELELVRDQSLATLGRGNHFLEIQYVEEILDKKTAFDLGIKKNQVVMMIHSGSRSVGGHVGSYWEWRAREAWPKESKWPEGHIFALHGKEIVEEYITAMNTAANYAFVNRLVIAEVSRLLSSSILGEKYSNMPLVFDLPHNIVQKENGMNIHRKGACPAHENQIVLIPGSMGHPSYILKGQGNKRFLSSASHGAGRALNRFSMGRNKAELKLEGVECYSLKEERKIEEAPGAYKDIGPVIDSQVKMNVVFKVAKLIPICTFKA